MDSNNERIIKLTKILIFLCGIFLIFPIILFVLPQVRELKNNLAISLFAESQRIKRFLTIRRSSF